ncbi:hypothetical protein OS493_022288 [Desmophyllum pertusum]|uniref:Uncharacterized protein n=1 Tax=Desmophyllum pertusum TaxID=174260 RepID=A0A9W9YCM1_9CNID|nr:hypothetical protein OS493_022288 [Desmophyllum pertusum]
MHDFNKPLGMSEAKRRRIEDENSNVPNETQVKDKKSASTPNKDHLTESIEENKTITIEDDDDTDETAQMLATFVDSYPDSDE